MRHRDVVDQAKLAVIVLVGRLGHDEPNRHATRAPAQMRRYRILQDLYEIPLIRRPRDLKFLFTYLHVRQSHSGRENPRS